jgi:hypothetical protein
MKQASSVKSPATATAVLALACLAATPPAPTSPFPSYEVRYSESNPKIIWGQTTNLIRGGYGLYTPPSGSTPVVPIHTSLRSAIDVPGGMIKLAGQPLKALHPARLYIESVSGPLFLSRAEHEHGEPATNWVRGFEPPVGERLAMTMIDAAGNPVPRTGEGRALGKPLSVKPHTPGQPWRRVGLRGLLLPPRDLVPANFTDDPRGAPGMDELNPARYFKMRRPGIYWLTVVQRLYVTDTNMCLMPVCVPPVTVEVRVAAAPPGAETSRLPWSPLLDAVGGMACAGGIFWLYIRARSRHRTAARHHLPNLGLC